MNIKGIMVMVVFGILMSMVTVHATVTPVLDEENMMTEIINGTYSSYKDSYLTIEGKTEVYIVKVDEDQEVEPIPFNYERTLGAQLTNLPKGTFLELLVTKDEKIYNLIKVNTIFLSQSSMESELITMSEATLIKDINGKFNAFSVTFKEESVEFDVQPQVINGCVMVPLRAIAEILGYKVEWENDTKSISLIKGSMHTDICIGKNSYYKFKTASVELSMPATLVEGRTLVPIEFITEILGFGVVFKEDNLKIYEETFMTLIGYISEIQQIDSYKMMTIVPALDEAFKPYEKTIIIVNDDTIINREELKVGQLIKAVHFPVMTMSIPAQTSTVIIY